MNYTAPKPGAVTVIYVSRCAFDGGSGDTTSHTPRSGVSKGRDVAICSL